jgi:hypothetical protein
MIVVQLRGDVQRGFQQFDVFVKNSKQGFDPASNLYSASHGKIGQPRAPNTVNRKGSHLRTSQRNYPESVLERNEGVKEHAGITVRLAVSR